MKNSQYLSQDELKQLEFAALGENVLIHRLANIVNPSRTSIGNHVRIDGYTTLTGEVKLGNYIHIGTQCLLAGGGGVTVDDYSTLSHGVKIFSTNDDYSGESMTNPLVPVEFTRVTIAPVSLASHVIIGANSVVLPGLTIEEGVAVGSLSLVKSTLPAWGIYGGNPARHLKPRSKKLLSMAQGFLVSTHADLPAVAN